MPRPTSLPLAFLFGWRLEGQGGRGYLYRLLWTTQYRRVGPDCLQSSIGLLMTEVMGWWEFRCNGVGDLQSSHR